MNLPMRTFARLLTLAAFTFLGASPAWAVLACSITAAPSPVTGIYAQGANRDIAGSFTVTCTRNRFTDERRPYIWIGIDQTAAGQTMPRDIGGATLTYFVYRRNFGQGTWLNTGAENANANTAGALRVRLDFGNTGTALTQTFNFYFRIPSGQNRPAGVYIDTPVPVTLRDDNQAGAVLGTTALNTRISIQHSCRFGLDPAPVTIAYTAFSAKVDRVIPFELVCTQGTTYTMALDASQGIVPGLGIKYTIALNATGSITGTAVTQGYAATLSILGGQAGRCAGATCNAVAVRTVTVTY